MNYFICMWLINTYFAWWNLDYSQNSTLENGVFAIVVHLLCFHFTLHIASTWLSPSKAFNNIKQFNPLVGLSQTFHITHSQHPQHIQIPCITGFTLLNIHFPFWPHSGTYLGIRKPVPVPPSKYVYIIFIVTKVSYWLEVKKIGFEVLRNLFWVNEW